MLVRTNDPCLCGLRLSVTTREKQDVSDPKKKEKENSPKWIPGVFSLSGHTISTDSHRRAAGWGRRRRSRGTGPGQASSCWSRFCRISLCVHQSFHQRCRSRPGQPRRYLRESHSEYLRKYTRPQNWPQLTNHVGQNEVPPGDEGPDLPHSHVAVQVSRAGLGNARPKLGVAQAGHDRGQSGDQEGDDDTGAGVALRHLTS